MRKRLIKAVVCILLVGMIFTYINNMLFIKYSDGIYSLNVFYELEDDTVDVLFLGSSHAFEDFNTSVLWDEYGMASYVLGGSMQPTWNTYYYLKEALETQKPQLIVLEGYGLTYSDSYMNKYQMYKNTLGIRSFSNRISNINTSVSFKERFELLFPLFSFHDRYAELTYEDFLPNKGDMFYESWKGFANNFETEKHVSPEIINDGEVEELSPKTEKYYRKIIELAQKNDIPIMVIVNPYPDAKKGDIKKFNRAKEIAAKYKVDFFDYSLDEEAFGIDYGCDVSDKYHLNYKGNKKLSLKIGEMIVSKYHVSDRRGDAKYSSWEENSKVLKRMVYNYENKVETAKQLGGEPYSSDYALFVFCGDQYKKEDHLEEYMMKQGIVIGQEDKSYIWFKDSSSDEIMIFEDLISDFFIKKTMENDASKVDYNLNEEYYTKSEKGINVVVYDKYLEKVVDNYGIEFQDDFVIIR